MLRARYRCSSAGSSTPSPSSAASAPPRARSSRCTCCRPPAWACSAASSGVLGGIVIQQGAAAAAARLPSGHRLVRALAARHRARTAGGTLGQHHLRAPAAAVGATGAAARGPPARRRPVAITPGSPHAADPPAARAQHRGTHAPAGGQLADGTLVLAWNRWCGGGALAHEPRPHPCGAPLEPGAMALRVAPGPGQPASSGQPDHDGRARAWLRRLPARDALPGAAQPAAAARPFGRKRPPQPRRARHPARPARAGGVAAQGRPAHAHGPGADRAHAHQRHQRAPGAAHRRRLGGSGFRRQRQWRRRTPAPRRMGRAPRVPLHLSRHPRLVGEAHRGEVVAGRSRRPRRPTRSPSRWASPRNSG